MMFYLFPSNPKGGHAQNQHITRAMLHTFKAPKCMILVHNIGFWYTYLTLVSTVVKFHGTLQFKNRSKKNLMSNRDHGSNFGLHYNLQQKMNRNKIYVKLNACMKNCIHTI